MICKYEMKINRKGMLVPEKNVRDGETYQCLDFNDRYDGTTSAHCRRVGNICYWQSGIDYHRGNSIWETYKYGKNWWNPEKPHTGYDLKTMNKLVKII